MTRIRSVVRLRSRQLVGLRHRKEFVEGMEAREIIALTPIKKAFLPNINVKEPEKRAKRQTLRQPFQFSAAIDFAAADPAIAAGKPALGRHARFPIRVAVMFFDEYFHRRKSVMVHLATEAAGWPLHNHVFVDLVVPALRVGLGQLLVTA